MTIEEYNSAVVEIYDKLYSADDIKRNQACTEALNLIEKIEKDSHKNDVRKMIVFHLFDSRRFDEANTCIDALLMSDDYYYKSAGFYAKIEYCKLCAQDELVSTINSARLLAKQTMHKADFAIYSLEYAKHQYINGKYDDCIESLGDVIVISEELNNIRFLLAAKYYTALAVNKKGLKDVSLEMLREVTEKACDVRSQHAAMFSELKRAEILNEVGRKSESVEIIKQWCVNFETQL